MKRARNWTRITVIIVTIVIASMLAWSIFDQYYWRNIPFEVHISLLIGRTAIILISLITVGLVSLYENTRGIEIAEMKYETIVNTALDAFIGMDENGYVIDWNKQAEVIFGYYRDEAIGKKVADLIIPEHYHDDYYRGLKRFCETRVSNYLNKRIELTARCANAQEFPVELTVAEIGLQPECMFGAFIRDTSDLKNLVASMNRMLKELQQSNDELQNFAYAASHDLQEPLRIIAGYAQLIVKHYRDKLDDRGLEFLGYMVEAAKRLQAQIDGLLLFARVGTRGRGFTSTDATKVCNQAIADLAPVIDETKAIIESSTMPVVFADPIQLTQVFRNLLSNALKFRVPARTPHIRINYDLVDSFHQFSVEDNGIGIEKKHLDKIFVIFRRLHTQEEYPGTGIGLSLCKRIVERHGGKIWVESEPGVGTKFFFTIPVQDYSDVAEQTNERPPSRR